MITDLRSTGKKYLPILYLLVIFGINLYIVRDLFRSEHTGHTNSIQGLWITIARLAGEQWIRPAWWPYQDGGMPFEHTYMPLVPASTALIAKLAQWPAARAFHTVMGLVYILSPVTMFLLAWQLTRAPGYAFWAGVIYTLTSPARALIKDPYFDLHFFWTCRRMYTTVVWDDVPHQAAVCFLPLAFLFLWRTYENRRPLDCALAALFAALSAAASVFGAVAMVFAVLCMLAAQPLANFKANVLRTAIVGAVAYLAVCPFLPPSLIAVIRSIQQRFPEDQWSINSWYAAVAVAAAFVVLWLIFHRTSDRALRFFVLFAAVSSIIPVIDAYRGWHFLPQAGRYQPEMEVSLAWAGVFLIRPLSTRLPRVLQVALVAALVYTAVQQVIIHRRYAKTITRPVDITSFIEYRVAKWVDANIPGQRVMVPGSMAQWFSAFSDSPQLSGASYSTALNWNQQEAMVSILGGRSPQETEISLLWLKAFGIQAVVVCGPDSTEFWKPYSNPTKFEGKLPVWWKGDGVTIYRVPQRSPSLAHVIPASSATRSPADLGSYAAALDDSAFPLADMNWEGPRRIRVRTTAHPGQAVSVQTAFHPGWSASANGRPAPVRRDGLGFLLVTPECDGPCELVLDYNGGWEYRICRLLGALTLLGLIGWLGLFAFHQFRLRFEVASRPLSAG